MKRFYKYLVCIGGFFVLSSCLKKETYPVEPVIEFKSFQAYDNSKALLVFKFTDGDGDVGLKPSDNLTMTGADSTYYYNLYIRIYYKNYLGNFVDTAIYYTQTVQTDSGLISVTKVDTGLIRQRIQYITNNSKDQALKGEIYVDLNGYRQSSKHKVLKYKFFMYDRAKHKSNEVETPELNVP